VFWVQALGLLAAIGLLVIVAGGSTVAAAGHNRPSARLAPPTLAGRFAFGVDAPVDFHSSINPVEAQYLLRKSLNRYRITGSGQIVVSGGEIVPSSSGTGSITEGAYQASGTISLIDQRKLGRDLDLILQVVGADSISTAPSTALHNPGVLETHVHLHVRVVRSNTASCPVGRTGSIFLTQNHYRAGGHSSVAVFLCGLSDSFTNDLYAFSADDNAVRAVRGQSVLPLLAQPDDLHRLDHGPGPRRHGLQLHRQTRWLDERRHVRGRLQDGRDPVRGAPLPVLSRGRLASIARGCLAPIATATESRETRARDSSGFKSMSGVNWLE
jgi:hypothetical protein